MSDTSPNPLLLLCGGQSGEHQVSLASARSVIAALQEDTSITLELAIINLEGKLIIQQAAWDYLHKAQEPTQVHGLEALPLRENTVVFPLLHGPFGEDGRVQGWLDMLHIPYIGSGVRASAVAMDKLSMKAIFAQYGLEQVAYRQVLAHELEPASPLSTETLQRKLEPLGLPLFVKPANLGSSVGISKVKDWLDLLPALHEAALYDSRIIVEAGVEGVRELEVAVLGNTGKARASVVGEISHESELYDYETKYSAGKAELRIPAPISAEIAEQCRALALEAYAALGCAGLARVDFFLDPAGKLWLNEINTMPGFTSTSMYPKLWQATGVSYLELIHNLIELARDNHKK